MRRHVTLAGVLAIGLLVVAAAGGHRSIASPVPLRATPRVLLKLCAGNRLLRPICPRLVPASGPGPVPQPGYYCMTRNPHASIPDTIKLFHSNRCAFADWSYVGGLGMRDLTVSTRLTGWNGRHWVADEWSMLPPPLHVGVEIQASLRSAPQGVTAGPEAWPRRTARISDALLGPTARAVSLGWVTWYGRRGQLVLTPWGPCETGNELIFYIPPNLRGVSYAIRLDAWMGTVHLSRRRVSRTVRVQAGPSLRRVIATLRAIVGSALTPRGTGGSRR